MTTDEYIKHIKEELSGAEEYAKKFISYKTVNRSRIACRYKEMSLDELKHAKYIYEEAMNCLEIADTEPITDVYVDSASMIAHMLKL